jgi:hypothetical protein
MLVYGYYFKLPIITMEIPFLLVTEKTEIYSEVRDPVTFFNYSDVPCVYTPTS